GRSWRRGGAAVPVELGLGPMRPGDARTFRLVPARTRRSGVGCEDDGARAVDRPALWAHAGVRGDRAQPARAAGGAGRGDPGFGLTGAAFGPRLRSGAAISSGAAARGWGISAAHAARGRAPLSPRLAPDIPVLRERGGRRCDAPPSRRRAEGRAPRRTLRAASCRAPLSPRLAPDIPVLRERGGRRCDAPPSRRRAEGRA